MHRLLFAFLVAVVLTATHALADCHVRVGDRVVLYGTTDDPDVFLWDSRFRMHAYQAGSFDQAQLLLPHATIAPPGTRAVVSECVRGFVQLKYSSETDDAIGVTIISGPLRGKRGWVLGSDVRNMTRK